MVNSKVVIQKLPSLMLTYRTTTKQGWNRYMKLTRKFSRFKAKNPEKFNMLVNRIIAELNDLEREVNT